VAPACPSPIRRARAASRLAVGLTLAVLAALFAPVASAQDQEWSAPRTVWVEEAGHTVDGLFLDAWREHKTLLGDPITEEITADAPIGLEEDEEHIVQYYENLALVYLPEDEDGEVVQALPLGRATLQEDRQRQPAPRLPAPGTCDNAAADACVAFDSGYTLRDGFKTFWEEQGGEPLLGQPITEEIANPDGGRTQYFERVVLEWSEEDGVEPRAIGEEAAKRLKLETEPIAQPVGIVAYDEALFVEPEPQIVQSDNDGVGAAGVQGPGPQQGGYKEVVVSISQQTMWAYEDGELVITSLVSTGIGEVPETETPIGHFTVLTKFESETMEGTISGEHYRVEDVPSVMYFDNNGNALHGTYWHSNFGAPMSHGCINLPLDVAAFLFSWTEIGTPVSVIP
jgi:hypothetical protein